MPKQTAEELWHEKLIKGNIEESIANCEFFIDEHVYIEDKDAAQVAVKFQMWPRQREALQSLLNEKLTVGLKARQLGFTWLALARATWMLLTPGRLAIALSKTEEDAMELVRRVDFILRHMPKWFMRQVSEPGDCPMTYDHTMSSITVFHNKNEASVFKSFPAGANSGRSFTGNILLLDEWAFQAYADEIYAAAFPTINRPGGGQLIGFSTMKLNTKYADIVKGSLAGNNGYKLIFWPWDTDPKRTPEWYEATKRAIGEDAMMREYPATVEEAFKAASGAFFNELNHEIHIREPLDAIPADYSLYASMDYGLDGLAVIWYWLNSQGRYRVYRELFAADKTISEAAQMILAANAGDELAGFFAPPDLWNRRQETGKSLAETFGEHGIYLTQADNDRERGWIMLKDMLRPVKTRDEQTGKEHTTALLTFDNGACPELWRCMTTIQRSENPQKYNDIKDKTADDHELTHMPDALRYFAISRTFPAVNPGMGKKSRWPFEDAEKEGEYVVWNN